MLILRSIVMIKRWLTIHRDLGLQLLALYLLLIVPFLVTLLVFDRLVGLRIREDVEANDLSLARAIAQETDISIDNALRAVSELAGYREVIEADIPGMDRLFKVTLDTRPDANLVYRLDENGTMLYHYPPGPSSTVGDDFSFRDYFQRSLHTQEPLISEGRVSPTTNQAVATAVMPLWSEDGDFLGLVGINLKLESLSETLSAIISEHQAEEGLQIAILDSSYKVIAHPESDSLLKPAGEILPDLYISIPANDNSSHIADGPDGVERLYTYAPISAIYWGVIVSRPTSAAFGTQIILQQITQVAAGTFVLIGLFFWGVLSIRVIRPIEQLAPISESIGLNRPVSPEERGQIVKMSKRRDQIGHLIRSILQMEESIKDRMKEQSTLLETSTAVVSSLDLQTVLDRILEQMARLLNVHMCAIIALDEEHGAFRIRASRGLSKRFTEQLSIQPSEPDSVTMRALHAKEPIFVGDTETDPSYVLRRAISRAEGYRAILAVPLNTQHAPPTALLVFHSDPHEFTYNEIQLLSSFANQATMAIENAILFERSDMRLQEQSRRIEALIQSMEDGLILSDPKGKVIYANRRIGDLAVLSYEELAGVPLDNVLTRLASRAQDAKTTKREIRNLITRSEKRKTEIALEFNGKTIDLRLEAFDVLDARGTSIGQGLILQDITIDREVDRMKSTLVSTVSHELRTPLAAIKGYASTLLAEDVQWDHESQREFIAVISNEADRLSNLVNSLLDLSRIEAGSLRLSREECHIRELVDSAAKQALHNGNGFEVQIEADLPPLYADPPRLESVLRNLIENSVKYAGSNAIIRVIAQREKDHIVFRVSDNGPGIPPEEAKRIFESFYRLDDSFSRITSGAGLGLAICQGLVHAHGGEIWVEPQDGGACIAFFIPLNGGEAFSPNNIQAANS
jgi:PAS domain S-box-containing protein